MGPCSYLHRTWVMLFLVMALISLSAKSWWVEPAALHAAQNVGIITCLHVLLTLLWREVTLPWLQRTAQGDDMSHPQITPTWHVLSPGVAVPACPLPPGHAGRPPPQPPMLVLQRKPQP